MTVMNHPLAVHYIHSAALEAYPEFVVDELLPIHDGYVALAMISLSTSELLKLCIGSFYRNGVEMVILYIHPIEYNIRMPIFNDIINKHKVKNVELIPLDLSDPKSIDKILEKIWGYISLNCCITEY